jgi:catechol 2,3-dioxygenase-like lactoylglutathione lyase family enzyme
MNQPGASMKQQKFDACVTRVAMNLEVDVIPVSDVERSRQFYQLLGWRLDEDVAPAKDVRIVQFTPPGSGQYVAGPGGHNAAPRSHLIRHSHLQRTWRVWFGEPRRPRASTS